VKYVLLRIKKPVKNIINQRWNSSNKTDVEIKVNPKETNIECLYIKITDDKEQQFKIFSKTIFNISRQKLCLSCNGVCIRWRSLASVNRKRYLYLIINQILYCLINSCYLINS
jgi:hypothetical protein